MKCQRRNKESCNEAALQDIFCRVIVLIPMALLSSQALRSMRTRVLSDSTSAVGISACCPVISAFARQFGRGFQTSSSARSVITSTRPAGIQFEDSILPRLLNEPADKQAKKTLVVDSAEAAIEHVLRPGQKVYIHTAAATPSELVVALATVAKARDYRGIEVNDSFK